MDFNRKTSLLEDIQDLDRKLIKMIARRTELNRQLCPTGPKSSGAASKQVANEKELRNNWEREAAKVSRDERFLRRLFALLQEFDPLPPQIEKTHFNLSPSRQPVNINMPCLSSDMHSRGLAFIAAASGSKVTLYRQTMSDAMIELVKGLNQAGAHLSWDAGCKVLSQGGDSLNFQDKTIFAGGDEFNFYLMSALALGQPGVVKFTGDSKLKLADLSAWRNVVPCFGARLAHVIPKSSGLPVHLECSGMIPEEVTLPDNLPRNCYTALLLAAPFWSSKRRLQSFGTEWEFVLKSVLPCLETCNVKFVIEGNAISFEPGIGKVVELPHVPADLFLTSAFLAFPAFAGGESCLNGPWPEEFFASGIVEKLFNWAGLSLEKGTDFVRVKAKSGSVKSISPLDLEELPLEFLPLAIAFAANYVIKHGIPVKIAQSKTKYLSYNPDAVLSAQIVQDFLQCLGAELKGDDSFDIVRSSGVSSSAPLWTAPDAYWGIAFALSSYLRGNIGLTNPAVVSSILPAFWSVFNNLPDPALREKTKEESVEATPSESRTRRKIVT